MFEALQPDDPFAQVGELNLERVVGGEFLQQRYADVPGVFPREPAYQIVVPFSAVFTAVFIIISASRRFA